MGAHLLTEKFLSSILSTQDQTPAKTTTYTTIREGLYSESFPVYTAWFDVNNPVSEITIPHDGNGPGIAWAKTDELGEATAKTIVSYVKDPVGFRWVNSVVLFSGPRAVSLKKTVEILARVTGKDVRIKEVSADAYAELPFKEKYWYHGKNLLKEYTSCWKAFRLGEAAVVSPLLGEILGREPENFETTVRGLLA
jgi:hypothetical protein